MGTRENKDVFYEMISFTIMGIAFSSLLFHWIGLVFRFKVPISAYLVVPLILLVAALPVLIWVYRIGQPYRKNMTREHIWTHFLALCLLIAGVVIYTFLTSSILVIIIMFILYNILMITSLRKKKSTE